VEPVHIRRRLPGALAIAALGATVLATTVAAPSRARADAGAGAARAASPDPRRARVAVRVGDIAVTVGEIEDRLAEIPPFQRRLFGATLEAQVKAYVEQVVVRDTLLAEGARTRELAAELPTSQHLRRARSSAALRALRKGLPTASSISDDEVRKFYDDNRTRFEAPERIHILRVLARTRDEAEAVLSAAKKEPTTPTWNDLARERSVDKATHLRGGNLGFVGPDGASNEAGVSVDLGVVKAARAVKDGEIVDHVVPEGEHFAVIWRRGTVPETHRPFEEAAPQIRTMLYRERAEAAEKKLLADLRAASVKDVQIDLLGTVDLGAMDAGFMAPRVLGRPPASSGSR
jgi:peptidyl-prolyl cis-trans isomerase C